jgi:hypothetical protein
MCCVRSNCLLRTEIGVVTAVAKVENPRAWFQQDGSSVHFTHALRDQFVMAGLVLVGVSRPPRSPALAPLKYFLWGRLNSLIYEPRVRTQGDLATDISVACETFQKTPGIFERVHQATVRRRGSCNEIDGRHFMGINCE